MSKQAVAGLLGLPGLSWLLPFMVVLHFAGIVVWAWYPENDLLLLASAIPLCGLMIYLFLRNPPLLVVLSAWVLPLSTERLEAGWIAWLGLVPLELWLIRALFPISGGALRLFGPMLGKWQKMGFGFLLVYGLWLLICSIFAEAPGKAIETSARFLIPALALALAFGQDADGTKAKQWLQQYFLAMLFVLAYAVVLSPHPAKGSSIPFFPGNNALAAALLPPIFLLPWAFQPRSLRLLGFVLAGLVACWVFFTSRGATLGLLMGLLAMALCMVRRPVIRWSVLGLTLAALAVFLWPQPSEEMVPPSMAVFAPQNEFSNSERQMRWELAFRIAEEHPAMGMGPSCFAPGFKRYLREDAEVARISYWHGWTGGAHQLLLNALAETGWAGALLLLAGCLGLLIVATKNAFAKRSPWALGSLGAIVAILAHGMVEDLPGIDAVLAAILVLASNLHPSPKQDLTHNHL